MQSNDAIKMKSNRRTLVILFLVFLLPAAVSLTMYITGWRPASTVNHGELISPPLAVSERDMQTLEGKKVSTTGLRGKWSMVFIGSSSCPEACMSQLYFMRQTHLSQGKSYSRLQRFFILTDTTSIVGLKSKLADYPDMQVLGGDKNAVAGLLQDFGVDMQSLATNNYIYLIDPQGNVMMRYKAGSDPAGTRKDIERLLKYSNE